MAKTAYFVVFSAFLAFASGQECFFPFIEVDGLCFNVVKDTELGFEEARAHCNSLAGDGYGGDLISPSDCHSFTTLGRYLELNGNKSNQYWVGAETLFTKDEWFWLNLDSLSTGVPFFAPDEGIDEGQECAAMDGSKFWRLADEDCTSARPFICSIPTAAKSNAVTLDDPVYPPIDCPVGSVQIGGYCYVFSAYGNTKYWTNAEENCREDYKHNNGLLFYPETCEEFARVAHHIEIDEGDSDWWVGARDATGAHTWSWVDGASVPGGLPYWSTGEPNHKDDDPNDQCAMMSNNHRFYMVDAGCRNNHRYICKLHTY